MKTKNNALQYHTREQKSGGKFFSGLLWGAALGGGAAYVLSTKRGRDLLKELVHDGLDLLEKEVAPQKKAVKEILNPMMEEEIVPKTVSKVVAKHDDKIPEDKKIFFKKVSKK